MARALAAITVALGLLGTTASTAAADVEPQIVGGTAPTLDYPAGALVSLKYDAPAHGRMGWHTCGATKFEGRKFRVAAHCVSDPPPELSKEEQAKLATRFDADPASMAIPTKDKSFWVRVGSQHLDRGGVIVRVKVVWVHEGWNWATKPGDVNDVARLEAAVDVPGRDLPIAPREARVGDDVFLLGWGLTKADGSGDPSPRVRELKTRIVRKTDCAPVGISRRDICIGNVGGKHGVCYGDSGGPAVVEIRGRLYDVGIASRSSGLCGEQPAAYTSTPAYWWEIHYGRNRPADAGAPTTG